ncbi:MAG: type II secretion system protein [Patescibacteria group bacterium]|jgi:prepilin-type N-terminal cleavage/methylation domain-containing protein
MIHDTKYQQGLTWIEVLIVITIIGLLAVILLNFFNPLEKRDQATNSRQKSDLDRLAIALEDYYNDKGCYPTEVSCEASKAGDLRPYLGTIPCDPATGQSYFYDPEDSNCPKYYRIYTTLKWEKDPAIAVVGCLWGCGPVKEGQTGFPYNFPFNYGVSSPNKPLESAKTFCTSWTACQASGCNVVGERAEECCPEPNKQCEGNYESSRCYCNDPCCGCECPDCGHPQCKDRCSQCK